MKELYFTKKYYIFKINLFHIRRCSINFCVSRQILLTHLFHVWVTPWIQEVTAQLFSITNCISSTNG